ncbi:hypothetical protein [Nocardia sp. NPDC051750]|uniref:hypothetical protein n=1 Tax=Nocardia sp. NPDC051750 TaxID=3364325 RepID=UPI00378E0DAC
MTENNSNGAIPDRRLPPGWVPPEPETTPAPAPAPEAEAERGAELHDDDTTATDTEAPPSNLFILPGLPAYAGLETVAQEAEAAEAVPTGARDQAAPDADAAYSGEWSQWLDGPERKAPAAPAPAVDDDEYDDDAALDEANVYVPDYSDATAMAAFRDRSGGRPVRPAMSREKVTGRSRSVSPVWRIVAGSLAVAATAAVVGVVVVVNVNAAKKDPVMPGGDPAAAGLTSTVPATSALPVSWKHATAGCTRTRSSSMTIGADPGDHSSPQMAILGFEWAYYVDRDAVKVRTFTTPDAKVSPAETIQAAIDNEVPEGTRYCVYITAGDGTGDVWDVELHEQWPTEAEPARYGQRITTTTEGGKALITAITKR